MNLTFLVISVLNVVILHQEISLGSEAPELSLSQEGSIVAL